LNSNTEPSAGYFYFICFKLDYQLKDKVQYES